MTSRQYEQPTDTLRDLTLRALAKRSLQPPPHPWVQPKPCYQEPFQDFAERVARYCGILHAERVSHEALEGLFLKYLEGSAFEGLSAAEALVREAAPEMLAALEMILPLAERYLAKAPSDPDNAKLETARAALVKALGGPS